MSQALTTFKDCFLRYKPTIAHTLAHDNLYEQMLKLKNGQPKKIGQLTQMKDKLTDPNEKKGSGKLTKNGQQVQQSQIQMNLWLPLVSSWLWIFHLHPGPLNTYYGLNRAKEHADTQIASFSLEWIK